MFTYIRSDFSVRLLGLLLTRVLSFLRCIERLSLFSLLAISLSLGTSITLTAALPSSNTLISSQTGEPWTNFSIADGLVADSVIALEVASNGYLWVGTNEGVSILSSEGDWLTLIGLGENFVADITPDPINSQRHWFATYEGGILLDDGGSPLDQTDDIWVTFGESDGLVNQNVWAVDVDINGFVWLGTNFIDSNGDEHGYGVSVLDVNGTPFEKSDDFWTTYTTANSNLSHDVIRDIATSSQGAVWIATKNGLNVYSGGSWTVFDLSDGLAANGVTALMVEDNLLWIATQGGVSVLDYSGTPHDKTDDQWATYTQYNSDLADNDTSSLAMDRGGRIWIGTDQKSGSSETGYGVSVLDTNNTPFYQGDDLWTTFNTYSGLAHNAVRAVVTSKSGTLWIETVWIGTREGLSRLDYGSSPFYEDDDCWKTYMAAERLAGNSVYAVAGFASQWLGTDQGLSLLRYNATPHVRHDDYWMTYTTADGLAADSIRTLAVDGTRLWIGTAAGLTVLDTRGTLTNKGDDISITYDSSSGLSDDQVNDIVIDGDGRAWIGCGSYHGGGLHVLDIGTYVSYRSDDVWATFTSENSGLPDPYVVAIAIGGGDNMWVGTYDGAARLNYAGTPFSNSDDNWIVFTSDNSDLAYNTVRDIALDQTGNIWFGLAIGGVSVRSDSGDWITFTQSDGLAYDSVQAVAVDRTGSVWLGTDGGGVSVLDYAGTLIDKYDDVWKTYVGGEALLSSNIETIAIDDWGQVWLGTFGGGASIYSTLEIKRVYLPVVTREV